MHVRMAPEASGRRVAAALLACCCLAAGCSGGDARITAAWNIEPTPPVAGTITAVRVTLTRGDGTPAVNARLRLEGHMSHPGMAPVTAEMLERGNGVYDGRLQLSMPGDWVFVVSGELAGGTRISKDVTVPSVRPASEPTANR